MTPTLESDELLDRFLSAVEEIVEILSKRYNREFKGIGEAIRTANDRNDPVVQRNFRMLKTLADLRNAIQHGDRKQGMPVATPREDTVEWIETLEKQIKQAPQVKDHMIKDVDVLSSSHSLADAAAEIIKHDISQMPVYDGKQYIGLFTTNAMARWLSKHIDTDGVLMAEKVTVAEVLECAENNEKVKFYKPTSPVHKVCSDLGSADGPVICLITTDGKETGQLQGLVTRFDVSRILKETSIDKRRR
ncbi:CBS domain-containing protein [Brevibacterium ravenspurgense]|uniref:CBS domain-containing protein n=1 Tax=Brevibacterium ravenspurgense TaxID=479117 RepID=UPI0014289393|nr:CBS domain-containing protein [Brevibacterium ravenspurgense]